MRRLLVLLLALAACDPSSAPPPEPPEEPPVEVDPEYPDAGPEAAEAPSDAGLAPFVDTSKVLGSFTTRYAVLGAKAARAKNIELAAMRLLGTELGPGERLSFNSLVGPRSKENGFLVAPVIFDGEMSSDVGGGVCQVSSTLHAAVLAAGIPPTFRRPHSRFSNYILPGLDATVIYPPECGGQVNTAADGGADGCWSVDFAFENPFPFPIMVGARVRDAGKGVMELTMSLLGGDPPGRVAVTRTVSYREPFLQEFRRGPVEGDGAKRVQRGERGSLVRTNVTVTRPDGGVDRRTYKSYYDPVDEIWEVGPGYDMDGPPPWEPREGSDAGAPDGATQEQGTDAGRPDPLRRHAPRDAG